MIKAGIIGASGYTGYELIKILENHPKVELLVRNSQTFSKKKVKTLYKDYKGKSEFTNLTNDQINKLDLDVVFLALPHTKSMEFIEKISATKIIDLSADYRFKSVKEFERIYQTKHKNPKKAMYGLTEINREKIRKAKLIANPGCYPTASLLPTIPIQKYARSIILDCKSGWSGAGRSSQFAKNPMLLHENVVAYNLVKHRHRYEMQQFLKPKVSFTPHVTSMFRGMMCTAHVQLKKSVDAESILRKLYKNEKFVKITNKIPSPKDVVGTNECHISGFDVDEHGQMVIVSVIDNLLKGASGQAVQNMNCTFGLNESLGL